MAGHPRASGGTYADSSGSGSELQHKKLSLKIKQRRRSYKTKTSHLQLFEKWAATRIKTPENAISQGSPTLSAVLYVQWLLVTAQRTLSAFALQ